MDRLDYRLADDGDLYFDAATGDLVTVEATQQHVEDIIDAEVGDFRSAITLAAAPRKHLRSPDGLSALITSIRRALSQDGFGVNSVRLIDGEIVVKAR